MENSKDFWKQINRTDLVDYLTALGRKPTAIKGANYLFYSPFKARRKPSLRVNRERNNWYDHGIHKGGSFIDFCILFHGWTIKDIATNVPRFITGQQVHQRQNGPIITIKETRPLSSYTLIHLLWERRIAMNVARKYCREATYTTGEHTRYAVYFPCDVGGCVLWNGHFIGITLPESTTYVDNHSSRILAVFKDFLDFLSFLTITNYEEPDLPNFLILHDPLFFDSSRAILETHNHVYLFPANDSTGDHWIIQATAWSIPYSDMRPLYKNYHSLNDWCCQGAFRGPSGLSSVPVCSDGLSP